METLELAVADTVIEYDGEEFRDYLYGLGATMSDFARAAEVSPPMVMKMCRPGTRSMAMSAFTKYLDVIEELGGKWVVNG